MKTSITDLDVQFKQKVKFIEARIQAAAYSASMSKGNKTGKSPVPSKTSNQEYLKKPSPSKVTNVVVKEEQDDDKSSYGGEASSLDESQVPTIESVLDFDEETPIKRGSTMIVPRKRVQAGQTIQNSQTDEAKLKI